MASLILIGAILIAIKCVDEHEKREKNRENNNLIEEDILSPNQDEQAQTKASKRDLLKPRYWHARRASRTRSRSPASAQNRDPLPEAEVPPPYEVPPMYRELEKVDYHDVDGQRN
ncbi:hypothetical protein BDV18DRAFT_160775 [Aspergillus unguis]